MDRHIKGNTMQVSSALLAVLLFTFALSAQEPQLDKSIHSTKENRQGGGLRRFGTAGNGISYHGGPLILGTTNMYYIWYGEWGGNTTTTILTDFANSVGGSPYFNINTTYYDASGSSVTNSVQYAGSTNDNYSQGTSLTDASFSKIVAAAVASGRLPLDNNGLYFVLTSADVDETTGFCTQYCGWHTHGLVNGTDVKYSFVGNPDRCPSACEAQTASSPNNNPGADAMASVIAHELEETVTDEDLNAWYDDSGQENADKCAWTFGTTQTAPNGSQYNVVLNGLQYLIQQNWVNADGGYCALNYGATAQRLDVWYPQPDGVSLYGLPPYNMHPLKMVIPSLELSQYRGQWKVDTGDWHDMWDAIDDPTNPFSAHKHYDCDFSGWDWRGSSPYGPFTITFRGLDLAGNVIAENSVVVYVTK